MQYEYVNVEINGLPANTCRSTIALIQEYLGISKEKILKVRRQVTDKDKLVLNIYFISFEEACKAY